MNTALLRPQPLPLERLRPGVGLLVLVLHLGLLWLAILYWPLQSVLFDALQGAAQSVTVQILQKTTDRNASADNDAALSANPQAISNPGRQRFGRAEVTLELPATQLEASTPLAGTLQTAQATPARTVAAAVPAARATPSPEIQPNPIIETPARPVPQAVAAPERLQPVVVRTLDEKLPEPALPQPPAAAPPSPVTAAAPLPAPAPVISASTVPASSVNPAVMASNPGGVTASGAATAAGTGAAVPGAGSAAAPALPPPAAGATLDLNLPPRYIYRPPIAVPRRSLSEMANEQLRRKPRDPFAEGVEAAGNIDCLKDTPEGPAQGLLAIGPLLKRAMQEKCRK